MEKHDDVLEAERRIREAIEEGAKLLDLSMLRGLTSLSDLDVDIADAASVTHLQLFNTPIPDLSPISQLTHLQYLYLGNTQITDLTPIAGMHGITTIDLSGTQITDLTPIAGMHGITTLHLSGTQITDLTPIAGMHGITTLDLSGTQITDLTPIAGMHGITTLELRNTQITDLTPIAGMHGITTLELRNTQITDLTPIAGMHGITKLYLSGTQITDLTPIAGMHGMESLELRNTQITDLTPIAGMHGMESLELRNTQVADLSQIAHFKDLIDLYIDDTKVQDLRPILQLDALGNDKVGPGLTFAGCAATRIDPKLNDIAQIEDWKDRLAQLRTYLADWVPPTDETTDAPAPDPIFGVSVAAGKIDLDQISPDSMDALKQNLHERLKKSSQALSKAAGNQFPRLCETARAIEKSVDTAFEDINLITLFMDGEILSDWMNAGREDGIAFPEEVTVPLSSTARDITGLTLGDPQIDMLAERLDRAKSQPSRPDVIATHGAMGQAIQADPDSMGPDIRRIEEKLDQLNDQVAVGSRKPMHRNVLWTIAMFAGGATGGVVTASVQGIAVEALSLEIKTFAAQYWPVIMATAETYGLRFASWFATSCTHIPELADQAKALLRRRDPK